MANPEIKSDESFKLPIFEPESFPRAHRQALATALSKRRTALGKAIPCMMLLLITAFTCVFCGSASMAAWAHPASPVLGSILAVFSAIFFFSNIHLTLVFLDLTSSLVAIPKSLRSQAADEDELEREIVRVNNEAQLWNSIVEAFRDENGVAPTILAFSALREEIRLQQDIVKNRIRLLGPVK